MIANLDKIRQFHRVLFLDTTNYLLTLKALLFKRYQFISRKLLTVLIPVSS